MKISDLKAEVERLELIGRTVAYSVHPKYHDKFYIDAYLDLEATSLWISQKYKYDNEVTESYVIILTDDLTEKSTEDLTNILTLQYKEYQESKKRKAREEEKQRTRDYSKIQEDNDKKQLERLLTKYGIPDNLRNSDNSDTKCCNKCSGLCACS